MRNLALNDSGISNIMTNDSNLCFYLLHSSYYPTIKFSIQNGSYSLFRVNDFLNNVYNAFPTVYLFITYFKR